MTDNIISRLKIIEKRFFQRSDFWHNFPKEQNYF